MIISRAKLRIGLSKWEHRQISLPELDHSYKHKIRKTNLDIVHVPVLNFHVKYLP